MTNEWREAFGVRWQAQRDTAFAEAIKLSKSNELVTAQCSDESGVALSLPAALQTLRAHHCHTS